MKILVLVMAHESDKPNVKNFKNIWDLMIEELKNYQIEVKFLYTNPNQDEKYIIDENKIISKCEENYWHSLLIKALNGFHFFYQNDYDLVFKTNLSTIINPKLFYDYCLSIKDRQYVYDGIIGDYDTISITKGRENIPYKFVSGAGMLLNKNSVDIILKSNDVSEEWTDDIFFGYVLNHKNNILPTLMNRWDLIDDSSFLNLSNEILNHFTHFRIKFNDEEKDIDCSRYVHNLLYK